MDADSDATPNAPSNADPASAIITALGDASHHASATADVGRMAAILATEASSTRSAAPTPVRMRVRLVAITAATAAAMGVAGTAVASESALPGDALYAVKTFLEDVGVREGGFDTRVSEAEELAERGDDDAALEHLADALEDEGEDEAAEELRRAAQAVLHGGSEQSHQVRVHVSEMLQWMATTDATGRDFGHGVAERARMIGRGESEEPVVDEPADTDSVVGDDEPLAPGNGKGRPDNAGGPAGERGSEGKGRPDNAGGPPEQRPGNGGGRPDNAGPPPHAGPNR